MPDNPTASTNTSILIPSNPVPHNSPRYSEWDVVGLVVGGAVALIATLGGVATLIAVYLSWLDRRRKLEQERDAPLENRVKILEDAAKNFRPVDYIDKEYHRLDEKVEHLKNNNVMKFDALEIKIERLEESDGQLTMSQTRLNAKMEGMDATIKRIEAGQERLGDRFDERFDRLQEMMRQNT